MELWSKAHIRTLLPALLVMVVLSAVFRLLLGKKSLKIRMIPIQIIAVLLILLEIGKQVCSFRGGYDLYHIPLHYCSLFLFTLPVMAFALLAVYAKNLLLLIAVMILAVGHIGIHYQHYKETLTEDTKW